MVDRDGRERVIVFGLVYLVVLGRSRRPAERDRIRFGLFCAAWLIEKAGRMRSYLVCHVASVASDDGSINDPTMYKDLARSEVHESIVMLFEHVTVSSSRTQFVHVAYDVILTILLIPISDWNSDD